MKLSELPTFMWRIMNLHLIKKSETNVVSIKISDDFRKAKRNYLISAIAAILFSLGQFNVLLNPPSAQDAAKLEVIPLPLIGGVAAPPTLSLVIMLYLALNYFRVRYTFERIKQVRENSSAVIDAKRKVGQGYPDPVSALEKDMVQRLSGMRESIDQKALTLGLMDNARTGWFFLRRKDADAAKAAIVKLDRELKAIGDFNEGIHPRGIADQRIFIEAAEKHLRKIEGIFSESRDLELNQEGIAILPNDFEKIKEMVDTLSQEIELNALDFQSLSSEVAVADKVVWEYHDLLVPRVVAGIALACLIATFFLICITSPTIGPWIDALSPSRLFTSKGA